MKKTTIFKKPVPCACGADHHSLEPVFTATRPQTHAIYCHACTWVGPEAADIPGAVAAWDAEAVARIVH